MSDKPDLSSLFANPYLPRTARLSPIPDNSPVTPLHQSNLRIVIPGTPDEKKPTVNSPLLIGTTAGGVAAQYPFPDGNTGVLKRRLRAVLGGSWHGGLAKRALLVILLIGLVGLVMYREVSRARS